MPNRILRALQRILLRLIYNGKVTVSGYPNLNINTRLKVINNGRIAIAHGVRTHRNVFFTAVDGAITISEYCFFNRNCIVICREKISIGRKCAFGPNVCIYDHDHCFGRDGIEKGYKTAPIIIEDNCWIGAGTIILRGSHIGEGSVIGAGCIVKGSIPAHSIVTSDRKLSICPIK